MASGRTGAGRAVPGFGSQRPCTGGTFRPARHPGGTRPADGGPTRRLGTLGLRRGRLCFYRRRSADADPAAAFAEYVERCWPRHRRLGTTVADIRTAATVALVEALSAGVESLSALLADSERVSAHLVLTPERVVAAEAKRTLGSLALMGVQVAELIVNQVLFQDDSYEYGNLPEHPAFDWYSARIAEQQSVLEDLAGSTGDIALVLTPHLAAEPIGPKALGQLLDEARLRDGSAPPAPLRPVVDRGMRLRTGGGLSVAAGAATT